MLRSPCPAAAAAAYLLFGCIPLGAQIQPKARYEGELLPIATCSRDSLQVLLDGRRRTADTVEYQVFPGPDFGPGFVELRAVEADLDPLRDAPVKERTHPSAIRFRYRAELVADRELNHCYGLLTFTAGGSVGTHLVPIGRLAAGRVEAIEAELRSQVDSVGSLHIFSQGVEVRSTDHPEPYSSEAYFAALVRDVRGIPAAELLKLERVFPHELSADGRTLATLREDGAKRQLIAYDLAAMKLLCQTPVAEVDELVRDLTWISEHELVYVAEEQLRSKGRTRLHLLDTRTGTTRVLLDDVYAIMASLPDTPEVLVLYRARWGHGAWTIKYNVRTGDTFDLQELGYGYSYFDRFGNDRVRVRFDGDAVTYYVRTEAGARWRELDEIVRQPGLHFNQRGAQLLDRVVDFHSIGPDGDTLYVSSRLGTDRFELAAFSLSEGVIKQTIAKHPRYDLTSSDGGLARLLFAKDSPQLLGMIYEAGKPEVVWLDPNFAAVQRRMDESLPDHVNLPIDWSRDGSTFVYFTSSDQDPGTYHVFRPLEGRLVPLLVLSDRLKGRKLARTVPIRFPARDGVSIPGYLTRPTEPGDGPPPLLVRVHGGPMVRDSWTFDATNQFFASRGYAVLQVNYRGSSGYGAAFQNAGLRARLDTVVLDDIADGVRQLIERGEADPQRVVIMGASFGGWATYLSLIKYPELYRAGVAISAIANWRKTLRDDRWRFDNKIAYAFWKSVLDRESFAEDEKFIDPLLRAGELKQPVYIMHGEYDWIVSPTEAKLMLEALRRHNPQVEARSFVQASHNYWPFADQVVRLNEAARFFDRHLEARPPSNAAAP